MCMFIVCRDTDNMKSISFFFFDFQQSSIVLFSDFVYYLWFVLLSTFVGTMDNDNKNTNEIFDSFISFLVFVVHFRGIRMRQTNKESVDKNIEMK